jgi:putative sterol carrier protein
LKANIQEEEKAYESSS